MRFHIFVFLLICCSGALPGIAQPNLERLLDQVDQSMAPSASGQALPGNFNRMPTNGPTFNRVYASDQHGNSQPSGHAIGNSSTPGSFTDMTSGVMHSSGFPAGNALLPPAAGYAASTATPGANNLGAGNMIGNLLRLMFGSSQQAQASAQPQNPFSTQNMLKTFFQGNNNSSPAGAQGNQQALDTAQEDLQIARDQAAQAESAAERAHYGERGYRQSAASEAQDHANAARAAADRATSAATGHFSAANDAASQARSAADRAQAAADRARYNASSAN